MTLAAQRSRDAETRLRDTLEFDGTHAVSRLAYEVVVSVGRSQPAGDVRLTFEIPASFIRDLPAGTRLALLADDVWLNELERLDRFTETSAGAPARTFTGLVPGTYFSSRGDGSRPAELVAVLVALEGGGAAIAAAAAAAGCGDRRIMPPLPGGPEVSSGFGPRTHPITGDVSQHRGVDFPVPNGTPVLAAGDGTVEHVGNDPDGAGHYIRISHSDGSKSWYLHLEEGSLIGEGQQVTAGEQIAGWTTAVRRRVRTCTSSIRLTGLPPERRTRFPGCAATAPWRAQAAARTSRPARRTAEAAATPATRGSASTASAGASVDGAVRRDRTAPRPESSMTARSNAPSTARAVAWLVFSGSASPSRRPMSGAVPAARYAGRGNDRGNIHGVAADAGFCDGRPIGGCTVLPWVPMHRGGRRGGRRS